MLAGLQAAGVNLRKADTVIGTPTGAFVGAAMAGGTVKDLPEPPSGR